MYFNHIVILYLYLFDLNLIQRSQMRIKLGFVCCEKSQRTGGDVELNLQSDLIS